ncbi:MAG: uracil-DNA glycosylase [Planctomycetes bacterium]|nr:uracil-DNA glycosylase [Planctomycetota bacterium]
MSPLNAPDEADPRAELLELSRALEHHLKRRAELGPARVPRAERAQPASLKTARIPAPSAPLQPRARPVAAPAELEPTAPEVRAPALDLPAARENRTRAAACASLGKLRALVSACTACALAKTRTQTVFADGSEHARVLFVGEAPGQNEDEQGVPFVGAAGQLLTDIIEKGMGLARSEVYIANVLKCRPPGNRDPTEEEKALCTPFLDRQIELLNPEVIIPLGLHATRHLLRSPLSMGRLRGRVHLLNGRKVIPTYHPAFLLRSPEMKKDCWQDIQLAMRELGLAPPSGGSRAAPR